MGHLRPLYSILIITLLQNSNRCEVIRREKQQDNIFTHNIARLNKKNKKDKNDKKNKSSDTCDCTRTKKAKKNCALICASSQSPSETPTESIMPSSSPSESSNPSSNPSSSPSSNPSLSPSESSNPSLTPSVSLQPSKSVMPSSTPSVSMNPSTSSSPTVPCGDAGWIEIVPNPTTEPIIEGTFEFEFDSEGICGSGEGGALDDDEREELEETFLEYFKTIYEDCTNCAGEIEILFVSIEGFVGGDCDDGGGGRRNHRHRRRRLDGDSCSAGYTCQGSCSPGLLGSDRRLKISVNDDNDHVVVVEGDFGGDYNKNNNNMDNNMDNRILPNHRNLQDLTEACITQEASEEQIFVPEARRRGFPNTRAMRLRRQQAIKCQAESENCLQTNKCCGVKNCKCGNSVSASQCRKNDCDLTNLDFDSVEVPSNPCCNDRISKACSVNLEGVTPCGCFNAKCCSCDVVVEGEEGPSSFSVPNYECAQTPPEGTGLFVQAQDNVCCQFKACERLNSCSAPEPPRRCQVP